MFLSCYFIIHIMLRNFLPPPGDIKDFTAKGKKERYYLYYFSFTSLIHAIIGICGNPVAMYLGGYRYNQPTHLYHMFVMCHAFAYFFFDSVIEIMYGTDDALTNIHHVIVLVVNYTHMNRTYGGFEFCLLYWLAEVTNPFLILRTVWKITGNTNTWYYNLNDKIFAASFILVRMVLSQFGLIYIFEGDNVLFVSKIGFLFIIYISFLWGFVILYNIAVVVKGAFETVETKDKGQIPVVVLAFYDFTYNIEHDKRVKRIFQLSCFFIIVVMPIGYYGFIRGNLFRNF